MNPVLIYIDTERINQEKSLLNNYVTILQNAYNAFKGIGITSTIQELNNLMRLSFHNPDFNSSVQKYAIDKLMAIAGNYTYNGVQLNQQVLKSQIAQPDLTAVNAAILAVRHIPNSAQVGNGAKIELLTLNADVISKVGDSDAQIESIYTYYTKTDASAQLATDLQLVVDAINTFKDAHTGATYPKAFADFGASSTDIAGVSCLAWRNGEFQVSLNYIRNFERLQAS